MESDFSYRHRIGEAIAHAIFHGIGCLFFFLACFNLLFLRPLETVPLVASVAWILIIAFSTYSGCKSVRPRQFCIDILSGFARRRFVRVEADKTEGSMISFGFRLASRTFFSLKFRARGIKTVDWGMGQASGMTGKDMNDWQVAVWFDRESVVSNQIGNRLGIVVVGSSGRKQEIEEFGTRLIKFLRREGVTLPAVDETLCGLTGTAIDDLSPVGRIRIAGTDLVGHAAEWPINRDDRILALDVRGTSVYAKKEKPEQDTTANAAASA